MPDSKQKVVETIVIQVSPEKPLPPKQGNATPIKCELKELRTSGKGGLQSDKIVLDPGEGPFCIELKLDGSLDWDQAEPLWIQEGACPGSNQIASQQIWLDRKPNGKTITLLNMNVGNPCELHYRMNFSEGYYCDPIMQNGGGNIFSAIR